MLVKGDVLIAHIGSNIDNITQHGAYEVTQSWLGDNGLNYFKVINDLGEESFPVEAKFYREINKEV